MKAIRFEQYGELAQVPAVQERPPIAPEPGTCASGSWLAPSTLRTCCLCADKVPLARNTIVRTLLDVLDELDEEDRP